MRKISLLVLLCWASLAWGEPADFQATQAVTDAGVQVKIDFNGDTVADPADSVCLTNDGPAAVVYDFDGTATFSATARAALQPGETRCFSRVGKAGKFTVIGFDTNTGLTASVRITAQP